jgi:hypothetical protein
MDYGLTYGQNRATLRCEAWYAVGVSLRRAIIAAGAAGVFWGFVAAVWLLLEVAHG